MAKFEVKNAKKFEELIYEVGDKYGLELNLVGIMRIVETRY